jgi:hypothetical protein
VLRNGLFFNRFWLFFDRFRLFYCRFQRIEGFKRNKEKGIGNNKMRYFAQFHRRDTEKKKKNIVRECQFERFSFRKMY